MTLELTNRRDQLLYFMGFVARHDPHLLKDGLDYVAALGFDIFDPDQVFQAAPENLSLRDLERSYHIYRTSKKHGRVQNMEEALLEFVTLAADFWPDCCGGGRSFYYLDEGGAVILNCDFCGASFDLDGVKVAAAPRQRMSKQDFAENFPGSDPKIWPYPGKLSQYLRQSLSDKQR